MEILIPIIAILGLFIGKLIGWMASDEIKPGMPYFFVSKRVIVFLIVVFMGISIEFSMAMIFASIAGAIVGGVFRQPYSLLGFSSVAAFGDLVVGSLVFVYGLIYGSLEKTWLKEVLMFFVPFLLLLTPLSSGLIGAFACGGLVSNLIVHAN